MPTDLVGIAAGAVAAEEGAGTCIANLNGHSSLLPMVALTLCDGAAPQCGFVWEEQLLDVRGRCSVVSGAGPPPVCREEAVSSGGHTYRR